MVELQNTKWILEKEEVGSRFFGERTTIKCDIDIFYYEISYYFNYWNEIFPLWCGFSPDKISEKEEFRQANVEIS